MLRQVAPENEGGIDAAVQQDDELKTPWPLPVWCRHVQDNG